MSLLLRFAGAWLSLFGAEHFDFLDTENQNALRSTSKIGGGEDRDNIPFQGKALNTALREMGLICLALAAQDR